MLENGLARRWPTTFQAINFLNRLIWQIFVLPFVGRRYDFIVLGRWSLSGTVYGTVDGVNITLLKFMSFVLLKPYRTIILSGDRFLRETSDSYERDREFQSEVERLYVNQEKTSNVRHVSNRGLTPMQVNDDIIRCLGLNSR